MSKKYTCKGCAFEEELDLNSSVITFPQCKKCCGIMVEHVEYDVEIAGLIPELEKLWYEFYPEIPVHVQLIYRDRRFKFRWYNGPTVEDVKHNTSFMIGYDEIAEKAGIPKNRRIHKRIFKPYPGRKGPYRTFKDLTYKERLELIKFVEQNIEHIRVEKYAMNTVLDDESSPENLVFKYGDSETLLDGGCVNYFCEKCKACIDKDESEDLDAKLIQHIIEKHL